MVKQTDLKELVENGVLTQEVADNVTNYYLTKKKSSNKALIIFGVIGAFSIGLGIISIIASNWDEYSRFTKTALSVLPLLLGQILAAYTLLKRKESGAWKEASAVFLLMAFGAVIAMIGQVYHLPSNLHSFITVWIWSSVPLLYLFNSSAVTLLFLVGITTHSFMFAMNNVDGIADHSFWLFLIAYLPYYITRNQDKSHSFGLTIQNWLVPPTILLAMITLIGNNDHLVALTFLSFFSIVYLLGQQFLATINTSAHTAFTRIGSLGITFTVLALSFDDVFRGFMDGRLLTHLTTDFTDDSILPIFLAVIAVGLMVKHFLSTPLEKIGSTMWALSSVFGFILVSVFLQLPDWTGLILCIAIGSHIIQKATESLRMLDLNIGLAMVLFPIIARFMEANLDFVTKGLILIVLGIGFILVNVVINRKMRAQA